VTYAFIAVHYPADGHREELHASMTRMAASLAGTAGLLEIGPWLDRDGSRLVGISRWASKAAFDAALPGSGVPTDVIHPGERKPREYFHVEAATEDSPGGSDWQDLAPELHPEPYVYAIDRRQEALALLRALLPRASPRTAPAWPRRKAARRTKTWWRSCRGRGCP
jgi:hypothetical protein